MITVNVLLKYQHGCKKELIRDKINPLTHSFMNYDSK